MLEAPEFQARAVCQRCSRPSSVCLCRDLIEIDTRTPIVILQHPRESSVPVGTARLAELAFKRAERHIGVRFSECPRVHDALSDAQAPPILLFPGDAARDLAREPPLGPVTLVVIDGTWSQASKMLKQNPELARLPRYALDPPAPSRYRIRREPARHCVSTIEAIVAALRVLESADRNVQAALLPFDSLVEQQLWFARERGAHRHLLRRRPRKARLPAVLRERASDLVVVYGETNAWPRGTPFGGQGEIVHWAAERVLSGERFEAFIAPRRALSPSFTHHTGVPEARVLGGEAWSSFCERWAGFCKPNDIVCAWGHFAVECLRAEGADTLPARLDVRPMAVRYLRKKPGDVLNCAADFGEQPGPHWALGRTGLRLSGLLCVVRALLARS